MVTLDFIKIALMLFLVCLFAPAAGMLIRNRPKWKRATMFLMCFSTIGGFLQAAEWGFTIYPIEYRGTARGFHLFASELLALVLIWSEMTGNWKNFRSFPPGMKLYLLYCFASFLSILNAPMHLYLWFAFIKAIKMSVIFVAAYNFLKQEDDLWFLLRCLAYTMVWECVAVLKMKYVDHVYQVYGTFEHQNALAMFSILVGMVFLAVALGPNDRRTNFYLAAYVVCAVIVQSTLSRGGLAVFAAGTLAVVLTSLMERVTKRRLTVLASLTAIAGLGLMFTMDTIVKRFQDYGNVESQNTRQMLNVAASKMLKEHPLGVGWNNFALTINHPYPYGDHIDQYHLMWNNKVDRTYKKGVVESLWWLLLAETGYQGLITYVLFISVVLFWNLRCALYFKHQFLGAVAMGLFWGFLMNYLQSFLERILTQPRNMMLWFILLAVGARIEMWRRSIKRQHKRVRLQQRRESEMEPAPRHEGDLQPA